MTVGIVVAVLIRRQSFVLLPVHLIINQISATVGEHLAGARV